MQKMQKEKLVSWLYPLGIFLIVTFIFTPPILYMLFVMPLQALSIIIAFILFGFIIALFSTYVLTPFAMRGVKPFKDAPPHLLKTLEELSREAGFKKAPKLMIVKTPEINAIAYTSIFGNRVGITSGLVDAFQSGKIEEEELKAILAHELGHHKNLDCLKRSFVFSWISLLDVFGTICWFIGMAITGIGIVVEAISREEGLIGLAVTLFGWSLAISGFIMKIIAKIASIPSYHFSRKQEYDADTMGAELTSPEKMASSLQKIEELNNSLIAKEMAALPYADRWTLRPINPSWIERLFDTHPLTEKRIAALLSMSTLSISK